MAAACVLSPSTAHGALRSTQTSSRDALSSRRFLPSRPRRSHRPLPSPASAAPEPGAQQPPTCGVPEPQAAIQQQQQQQTISQGQSPVEYNDSWSDIAFIALCRTAYGNIAGWQSSRSWTDGPETFRGMVDVSRALMRRRTAEQQRDAVIQGFPQVPAWFRRVFPYSKWGAELNARITPAFFTWLVGPMHTAMAEVDDGQQQLSAVKIERCRYLAESGCTAMCVNLCKAPTQSFFTEQLGMPLTMNPNFEDYSCEMIFGRRPPPLSEDPVAQQPCLAACPTAVTSGARCHKLD